MRPIYHAAVALSTTVVYNWRMTTKPVRHTQTLNIRISPGETEQLRRLANRDGVSMASWIRAQIRLGWDIYQLGIDGAQR